MNVLVLRALGLGDFLTAVPALRAVASAFKRHDIAIAMPAWLHPLLPLVGDVGRGVAVGPLQALGGLRDDRYDVAINLHGRGPQSTRTLHAIRPRRLIAFAHRELDHEGPVWRADEHEVRRWCRLLEHAGIATDPDDLRIRLPAEVPFARHEGVTIVHPGASTRARRWPVERFAEVARTLAARGERVVITGSSDDASLAYDLVRRAGLAPGASLAGKTTLLELAALVARAKRVISGDTGIAHFASGYGTPSVTLFGPVSPLEWGPPLGGPHHVLWSPGGLLAIGVDDVLEAVERKRARFTASWFPVTA